MTECRSISDCDEKTPRPVAICADASRSCGASKGAAACHARSCGGAALISRSGKVIPVAVASPKRHVFRRSTGSHSMVTARPVFDPAPTTFCASSRSMPLIRPRRRAESTCAAARLRLARERRAHGVDQLDDIAVGPFDAFLERTKARRIGVGQSALHPDLVHARREAIDVDAGHDHPRRVGFAHPQEQPRPLRRPIDGVHIARCRASRKHRIAQSDMRPARRDRRLHPPHQAGEESPARASPGIGAKAERVRVDPTYDARVAPRVTRIFDWRRRRLQQRFGLGLRHGNEAGAAFPDAVGRVGRRRRGRLRLSTASQAPAQRERWAAPCPAQAPEVQSPRPPPLPAGL